MDMVRDSQPRSFIETEGWGAEKRMGIWLWLRRGVTVCNLGV